MKLSDFASLPHSPEPWTEGTNIPWNEPEFSRRMLKEHLSQSRDAASRRSERIEQCVHWIHHSLLGGQPTRILDLGCGPGLYANRLAKLGHQCVGIDWSPASIAYAAEQAKQENLDCRYLHQDFRTASYGEGFGLVMQIFGELNVFSPEDVRGILQKACQALEPNGWLLLEPQTYGAIQAIGEGRNSWYFTESGLFSESPHLYLEQSFWDDTRAITTTRFFIVDAATGDVSRYALSRQAYTRDTLKSLLTECGFSDIRFFASLIGADSEFQPDMMVITGEKKKISS